MLILGIDTAGPTVGLALVEGADLLASVRYRGGREVGSTFAARVKAELASAARSPRDLAAIGVAQGPGSFTSLRAGVAFANSMAQALCVPVVGLPTLLALAWCCPPTEGLRLLAAVPCKRGEHYVQHFIVRQERWGAESEVEVHPTADVARLLRELGAPVLAVGEGLPEELHKWQVVRFPDGAVSVARLALNAVQLGETQVGTYVKPEYHRQSQAERDLASAQTRAAAGPKARR